MICLLHEYILSNAFSLAYLHNSSVIFPTSSVLTGYVFCRWLKTFILVGVVVMRIRTLRHSSPPPTHAELMQSLVDGQRALANAMRQMVNREGRNVR
jgi:hypothetical protein